MKILQVKNLKKTYGLKENRVEAVKNVSFSVNEGEFVAVVGRSGSGKSTLLNLLGGLDEVTEGSIEIRDKQIQKMSKKELTIFRRRNIGFVFQNYSLMPMLNVYDNIMLPVTFDKGKNSREQFIAELIDELGLRGKEKKYPAELSGGEQQRVAIARALANRPAVILADEPTGNLDSVTTNDVMGILWKCCRKYHQSILMVTHNEDIAASCDRILRMEDGLLSEVGGE